jgi:hypothetical protein
MEEPRSPRFANAGSPGLIGVLVGGSVLVRALAISIRAGRRRHALAAFAARRLPIPPAFLRKALGDPALRCRETCAARRLPAGSIARTPGLARSVGGLRARCELRRPIRPEWGGPRGC